MMYNPGLSTQLEIMLHINLQILSLYLIHKNILLTNHGANSWHITNKNEAENLQRRQADDNLTKLCNKKFYSLTCKWEKKDKEDQTYIHKEFKYLNAMVMKNKY